MLSTLPIIIFIFLGIFAGFLGGLLGLGGGAIVVPTLLATFTYMGFSPDTVMHSAVGTSLAAMVFTAGSSAWSHYKQKRIYWSFFKYMAPGIVTGAISGSFVAEILDTHQLKLIFGVLLVFTGIYFLLTSDHEDLKNKLHPSVLLLSIIGFIIGFISSLLGIGGGIITVPLLTYLGAPLRNSISTSAVSGFLIALFGALSFLTVGFFHSSSDVSVGDVYIPAFLIIGVLACVTAPIGARYAHSTHIRSLKLSFGVLQIMIGALMLY